nr:transglutaminase-like cysteine peptidase [uncultured Gellertiella sp.]
MAFRCGVLAVLVGGLSVASLSAAWAVDLDNSAGSAGLHQQKSLARRPAAPLAYLLFCLNHRDQCRKTSGATLAYTPRLATTLERVNLAVNRAIRPRSDVGDTWSVNPSAGDCDDYVMTKRASLLKQGVPSGAMRIAVVKTGSGKNHLVLFVATSAGEFVLDNLRDHIVSRPQMSYRVIEVSTGNPLRWALN